MYEGFIDTLHNDLKKSLEDIKPKNFSNLSEYGRLATFNSNSYGNKIITKLIILAS